MSRPRLWKKRSSKHPNYNSTKALQQGNINKVSCVAAHYRGKKKKKNPLFPVKNAGENNTVFSAAFCEFLVFACIL